MSNMLNRLLRPFIKFFFNNIYSRIPYHKEFLWFFCKQYFIEGWHEVKIDGCDEIKENWDPLKEKFLAFTRADYRILADFCTEDATSLAEAAYTRDVYREFIDIIRANGLQESATLSIKMSQFGCFASDKLLDAFGRDTATYVVRYARQHGDIQVIFDGEQLKYAPAVKTFVRELSRKYHNVGIRLQGYDPYFGEETERFVRKNIREGLIIPISICKGAYDEPDALSEEETRKNILWAIRYCREKDYPVELDTNDEDLIRASRVINVGMLYGIKADAAQRLQKDGYRVYIYFPVIKKESEREKNTRWEKFAIRRLVERPLYILYPLKSWLNRILGKNDYFPPPNTDGGCIPHLP